MNLIKHIIWATFIININKVMSKRYIMIISLILLSVSACQKTSVKQQEDISNITTKQDLILKIDDVEIPVIWCDVEAIKELKEEVSNNTITIYMSMYSDNEQFGSLNKNYMTNDQQMTTEIGDIVLYNSNQLVVFYGPNSWSYTKLGKINLANNEIIELLRKDVIITLTK